MSAAAEHEVQDFLDFLTRDVFSQSLRKGRVLGLRESLRTCLQMRFGPDGLSLMPWVEAQDDPDQLHLALALLTDIDDIETMRTLLLGGEHLVRLAEALRRRGREEGEEYGRWSSLLDAVEDTLVFRFGDEGRALMRQVREVNDLGWLQ